MAVKTSRLLVAALVLATACLGSPALADVPTLELHQKHFGNGRQKVFVSKNAVRIEHTNTGITALTRFPFTYVDIVNPGKRNYVKKPMTLVLAQMRKPVMLVGQDSLMDDIAWSKPEPLPQQGLEAYCYSRNSPKKSWAKLWTLKQPALPDTVVELISAFSGCIPNIHGAPLRYEVYTSLADEAADEYEDLPRKPMVVFETKSYKMVNAPDNIFSVPPGYECVNGTSKAKPTNQFAQNRRDLLENPDFMMKSDRHRLKLDKPGTVK